jgi:bifunctional UDP-N-acetylglucosamine pyrophosphorylase/glucosamine-1-phosphate N-acetyltransferase
LETAVEAGASRLVIVVGYEEAAVREHFGDSFREVPIRYVVQESQEGTAHALRMAQPHLEDGPFVVLAGDNLYDAESLGDLYADGPAVGAYEVEDARPYGVFEVTTKRVRSVVEKPDDPPSNLVNVSAYHFPAEAQAGLDVSQSERGEYELTDVLSAVIGAFTVRPVTFERWLDVGRPWELLEANEWKLRELDRAIEGEVHERAELLGDVVVEAGAEIRSGAVIEGPVLIQSGGSVGPNAYVRGATAIGPDAEVGHGVEIKNSVLMEGATVPHLSYVGDSLLGRDVNFGAGTNVANLRHDDEAIEMTVKGERVSTGRRKFGVVVGDGAKTGINTSLYPGVTLSSGAMTKPGESVSRNQ